MSVIAIPEVLRKKLGDDGVDALLVVFSEVADSARKDLSTKDDVRVLREDMFKLETKLVEKAESSKSDIIKWVAAMLVAQASLMAVMFKLLGLIK